MYTVIYTVVAVVNILFQTKKNTLVIGHCTALAVIATKTLAGKNWTETRQNWKAYYTSYVGVITSEVLQLQVSQLINPDRYHIWLTLVN